MTPKSTDNNTPSAEEVKDKVKTMCECGTTGNCNCSQFMPRDADGKLLYTFDQCPCRKSCPCSTQEVDPKRLTYAKYPEVGPEQTLRWIVKGIACRGCAASLKRALLADRRVLMVYVTVKTGETQIVLSVPKTREIFESLQKRAESAGFDLAHTNELPAGTAVVDIDSLESDRKGDGDEWAKEYITSVYNIGGMTCGSCVKSLEEGAMKIKGVHEVKVSLVMERMVVKHNIDPEVLREEIEDLGYDAELAMEAKDTIIILDIEELKTFDAEKRSDTWNYLQHCLNNLTGVKAFRVIDGLAEEDSSAKEKMVMDMVQNDADGRKKKSAKNLEPPFALEALYDQHLIGGRDILHALENYRLPGSDEILIHASLSKDQTAEREAAAKARKLHRRKVELIWGWALAIPILFISMLFGEIPATDEKLRSAVGPFEVKTVVLFILATPVQFYIGRRFYTGAWGALRHGYANMDVLVVLGSTAAYLYSIISMILGAIEPTYEVHDYFETSALLIMFVLLGKYIEHKARNRTGDAISKLMDLGAKEATVLNMNPKTAEVISEEEIPVELLQINDIVKVVPGGKVPSDGVVQRGVSHIDESMITGESIPVLKQKGDRVVGGSVNQEGMLQVRIEAVGSEMAISQIKTLIQDAQASKAPIADMADKISGVFVPIVVVIALVTFVIWISLASTVIPQDWIPHSLDPFTFALLFFISVLVIACPCALGLATPTAIMVGTSIAAREGVLIRGGEPLEKAHRVNAIIFDKTGTLTHGTPEVTDWVKFPVKDDNGNFAELDDTFLYDAAGSLESGSEHPLGRAIADHCKEQEGTRVAVDRVADYDAVAGRGITGVFESTHVHIGNRKFLLENDIAISEEVERIMVQLENEGKTAMLMAVSYQTAGIIAVADTIREESAGVVATLRKQGMEIWMITGDNRRTAEAVAKQAGIDNVFAEVMPEDKSNKVKELQSQGKVVAMVGDGVNDSPALAQADAGMAIGAGTDVAIEAADIVLMKSNLTDVVIALDVSSKTYRRIIVNFSWAFIYNTLAIPLAAGVLFPATKVMMPPYVAAAAMALSSISVVCSALLFQVTYRVPDREAIANAAPPQSSALPKSDDQCQMVIDDDHSGKALVA